MQNTNNTKEVSLGYYSIVSIIKNEWEAETDIDMDEIIINDNSIIIQIDYPLTHPASFTHISETDYFTRKQLIELIASDYKNIYETEEKTTKIKVGTVNPYMMNRNKTDGAFGIFGHDIGDLILHTAYVKNVEGKLIVTVSCDS